MEIFFTPEDVENEYGIRTNKLAQWRSNLIGPDFMKWKEKILYHSNEIEEWFEIQNPDHKPEEESKPESELKSEPEKEPELSNEAKPHTEPEPDTKILPEKQFPKDKLFTPRDLEKECQLSVKTLANWRSQGKGPAYFKLGNTVRYRAEEIEKWIAGSKIRIYGNDD